jgi:hypothetical protein
MQNISKLSKLATIQRYKKTIPFSETLNRFIEIKSSEILKYLENKGIKVEFIETQPYEDYEGLKNDFFINKSFKISTLFSDNTIFGDPKINHLNRLYHDFLHLYHNLDFTFESELILNYYTIQEGRRFGLNDFDLELLNIDTGGQIVYFFENKNFPQDQRKFVLGELYKTIVEPENLEYFEGVKFEHFNILLNK